MKTTKIDSKNERAALSLAGVSRFGTPAGVSRRIARSSRGANLVEYIMLVGLVAILCIVAFNAFGDSIKAKIGQEKGAIDGINTTSN